MRSRVERIRLASSKLPALCAEMIAAELRSSIAARGRASLCLSGGTTPRKTYEALAAQQGVVDWSKVVVYFGDERCVPPDHPDSNFRMASEALFGPARVAPESVRRMRGEDPDYDGAARAYDAVLPESFDVLVLGIGEDAHTASLFPGSAALGERARRVVHVVGDKPPPNRLTLTPPAIENARLVLVLATGQAKAGAVRRALEGPLDIANCPAQIARDGVWLLDLEASADLTGAWPT